MCVDIYRKKSVVPKKLISWNGMAAGWKLVVASVLTILSSSSMILALSSPMGPVDRCGVRLERALDALQRDSSRKNRLEEEEAGIVYQQKLVSAPLEMTVSRIAVKLPQDSRNHGGLWARVEQCSYEPSSNALQTRVMFNDLSVSGVISLQPMDYRTPVPAESCRMSLRLRRSGIEFYTSPIARARGQMRIRTESSFLEPRFASIYAYGCRASRVDKQIKRYDKWSTAHQGQQSQASSVPASADDGYEAPEPRGIAALTKEEDIEIANESERARALYESDDKLGIWRKNVWVTKIPRRRKRRRSVDEADSKPLADRSPESLSILTPDEFVRAISKRATEKIGTDNATTNSSSIEKVDVAKTPVNNDGDNSTVSDSKISLKRETTLSQLLYFPVAERESRDFVDDNYDQTLSDEDAARRYNTWQSQESVSSEMEDVFLRGASQALTRYIERELHPAIKETLMTSMGYTISYG